MHAQRYFERASKAGDLRAAIAMSLIGELYQVEREAKEAGLDAEGLRRLRIEKSAPIVERLRQWALQIRPGVVPSSPLDKALGYLKRRWLPLTVFLVDGRVPLDTGEVERNIRRVAVGRNAWLFSGSDAAASLCATCRRLGVDPWTYMRDVFTAIAHGISGNALVEGFTPWAWAKKQAQKPNAQQIAARA